MALVIADRVLETTTTTGTGAVTLAGAQTGYQSFGTAVGNGNTTYYTIAVEGGTDWEVGVGTYTSSGTSLSRDTVLASSNSGSLVNFGAGTKNVFVTYPAGEAVYYQSAGGVVITDNSSSTALRVTQTGSGNALVVEDSANPDSSPFVVNADGIVIQGTTAYDSNWFSSGNVPKVFQIANPASSNREGFASISYSGAPGFSMFRATGGVIGTEGAVANGDNTGQITFAGYDGTTAGAIPTAIIQSNVDGTPGVGDMPGRLVFSTTADGASSVTERMRIGSSGAVGIGTATTTTPIMVRVAGNISVSGDVNYTSLYLSQQANSFNTTSAAGMYVQVGATATATTTDLFQFRAAQGTFTAGAAITNQFGFRAESSLTGATNNYGFYSNIASGTGRWNFFANGTAANYFGGNTIINGAVGVGSAGSPSYGSSGQTITSRGSAAAPEWSNPGIISALIFGM